MNNVIVSMVSMTMNFEVIISHQENPKMLSHT